MLINRDLFRNILTLATGTAGAQLVAILLQPFLRRIFSPEDFGAYAVYLSLTGILAVVATMRYEPAIVQPDKKTDAINLVFLAFYINLVFCLLLCVAVFIFLEPLAGFLNLGGHYAGWLLLVPAGVFLLGTYQAMNYFLVRQKAFRAISFNKGMRRIVEGGIQMAAGQIRLGAGLVIGDIVGQLANVLSGLRQLARKSFSFRLHSFRRQRDLARQYADHPMYFMGPMALNVICLMLPTIYINKFYSQEIAGYFDLTRLVLVVPAAILTMSVGQVFLQVITEKRRLRQDLRGDFLQLLWVLLAIAAVKAIVMSIAGPWLLAVYAGAPYYEAGEYARILVWGSAFRTVASPLSMVFVGLRKLKIQAVWQIAYFILICLLPIFSNLSIFAFISLLAGVEILAYSLNFVLAWRTLNKHNRALKDG
jgi:O-antigen/teichoic acid export membrane protein